MQRMILVALSIIYLSACSSKPPLPETKHYLLDSALSSASNQAGEAKVEVRVTSLPDYLNQSNLVMLTAEHEMSIARYHSWANRVSDSVARIVALELNQNLASRALSEDGCDICYAVALELEHFYPSAQGEVFLSGYFKVIPLGDSTGTQAKKRFALQTSMQGSGYGEAVEKMRGLLSELALEISDDIAD